MAIATGTALAVGAALGAAKGMSNASANKKDEKFRKAAITYSPWTGMQDPGQKQRTGVMGSMLQGGLMGASMGGAGGILGGGAAAGGAGAAGAAGAAAPAAGGSMWGQLKGLNPFQAGADTWANKLTGTGQFNKSYWM
jgi:hypothetical protein